MRRLSRSRLAHAALATPALAAALALALHHPVAPAAATALLALWLLAAALRPHAWLAVVPAGLPLLSFAPWTGWLVFDEFDLLVLGAVAAGHGRLAWRPSPAPLTAGGRWIAVAVAFGLVSAQAFVRGLAEAGHAGAFAFQGYADPLNSWRVFKGLLYPLLLLPLLRQALHDDRDRAVRRLATGMLAGLAIACVAILWERAAYPGLLDFSTPYRTTALFWEMHVGGGALDAYLALATPFVAWALWTARSPAQWAGAAALALLVNHAGLTTFSRGVYLGMGLPLLLLGAALWAWRRWPSARPRIGWRTTAAALLTLALLGEAAAVLGGGSFMAARVSAGQRDFAARLAHWQRGLDLLREPGDWLLGIGLGRLPSRYAHASSAGEFSGAVRWTADAGGRARVTVAGPPTDPRLGGQFALTQRASLTPPGPRVARLHVRAMRAVRVELSLCEMHLLYPRRCQTAVVRIRPLDGSWQAIDVPLRGPEPARGAAWAPRMGVFGVSVIDARAHAEFRRIELAAADGTALLRNADFTAGLSRWFPSAQQYFLPWHIDSLAVELVVERGLLGASLALGLILWATRRAAARPADRASVAPFLAASLAGALIVGLANSVMDVPRVAFLLWLLCFFALALAEAEGAAVSPRAVGEREP